MYKVNEIIKGIENFAPTYLKEDFDNVGLMVGDRNKEVKKVLLALDCTLDVLDEAKKNEVDLIITHHPLIFKKPSNITTDSIQGSKIIELIKNDIALYSCHTNLDSAINGLNETIVSVLGFDKSEILEENKNLQGAGLGRIVSLDSETSLNQIVDQVKNSLNIKNVKVVIAKDNVKKMAIINGSGQSFIGKAIGLGVDCVITGDTTYHFAADCKEAGVSIIDIGHFASEQLVFFKVMDNILTKFNDIEFIKSKTEKDPYEYR